jgi:hypothetical protein
MRGQNDDSRSGEDGLSEGMDAAPSVVLSQVNEQISGVAPQLLKGHSLIAYSIATLVPF